MESLFSETSNSGRWMSLNELDLNVHVNSSLVDASVNFNRFAVVYTNSELLPWISYVIPGESSKKIKKKDGADKSIRFLTVPLTLTVEGCDLSAVAIFPNALPLRSGLTLLKVKIKYYVKIIFKITIYS